MSHLSVSVALLLASYLIRYPQLSDLSLILLPVVSVKDKDSLSSTELCSEEGELGTCSPLLFFSYNPQNYSTKSHHVVSLLCSLLNKNKIGQRVYCCNYADHGCFVCLTEFFNSQMNQLQTCTNLIWHRWEIKGTKFCDEVLMLLNYFQDSLNKICDDKSFPHDVKITPYITRDLETEMLRLSSALWTDVCSQDHLIP